LATVPVTVLLAGDSEQAVANVNVTASTRVYLWRARFGHGITNERGAAALQVEALSQSPTTYLFTVESTVVAGVLYEGVESVAVELPPGAASAPPITLTVNAYTGAISGRLQGMSAAANDDFSIWVIRLPDGESYQTYPSDQGTFTFSSVPIGRYLITVGNSQDAERGGPSQPQTVDLFANRETDVDIPLAPAAGSHINARIVNDARAALPFAWVTAEESGKTYSAALDSGEVVLDGLPADSFAIVVSAPGYYSQKQPIDLSSDALSAIELVLMPRPETRQLPWGTGTVVLPPETLAEIGSDSLILENGWLWGENRAAAPFVIQTPTAIVTLAEGQFALVYLPGKQAWLYQFDGHTQIQPLNGLESFTLQSGQMINLLNEEGLHAVSYNPVAVAALNPNGAPSIPFVWEPTAGARLRDQLAQAGINTAQIVTFVTYFIVLLSLAIIPLTAVYWQWKRGRTVWRGN
jgi:hypothetical protein